MKKYVIVLIKYIIYIIICINNTLLKWKNNILI